MEEEEMQSLAKEMYGGDKFDECFSICRLDYSRISLYGHPIEPV